MAAGGCHMLIGSDCTSEGKANNQPLELLHVTQITAAQMFMNISLLFIAAYRSIYPGTDDRLALRQSAAQGTPIHRDHGAGYVAPGVARQQQGRTSQLIGVPPATKCSPPGKSLPLTVGGYCIR